MKRFVIPAVFVVHASSAAEAEEIAASIQLAGNQFGIKINRSNFVFLDEKLNSCEVPISRDLPRSYVLDEMPVSQN
jgi:hypothetical protein